ncbi:MAG: hypothetical protein ACFB4J_14970 [Elainellaceae cyanobacterium]
MPQSVLLNRAKQGDADAIAALINRHAKHQGVVAQASLRQHCLHVILEGREPPIQAFWSSYLERALNQLGTDSVTQLHIYGRCYGAKRAAWRETISLAEKPTVIAPSVSATNPAVNPAIATYSEAAAETEKQARTNRPKRRATASVPNAWVATGTAASQQRSRRPGLGNSRSGQGKRPWSPQILWRSQILPQLAHFNLPLTLQWLLSTPLVGLCAAVLYFYGQSSEMVMGVARQLPPFAPMLICAGALGWLLGLAQAKLLRNWVVSSDRWEPVTILGVLLAGLMLLLQRSSLAIPILAVCQWSALRRWRSQAYGWIVVHGATAIVASVLVPRLQATAVGWVEAMVPGAVAYNPQLVAYLGLVWLFYSIGSAIAAGKLFYRS